MWGNPTLLNLFKKQKTKKKIEKRELTFDSEK